MDGFLPELGARAAQIELCLRLQDAGYKNIYTPLITAVWEQEAPAGTVSSKDKELIYKYHQKVIEKEDPYYNENCETLKVEYGLRRKA